MENFVGLGALFVAAMIAGAINSVAGGGTLISFPTLIAFGISSIQANATNTAALWPGSLSSAYAYSHDIKPDRKMVTMLLIPSIVGGLLGALALVATPPELFSHIVPYLVLFATVLFASRPVLDRLFKREGDAEDVSSVGKVWGFLFQLFVATYGGYFGAGIGILMLGSMSIMGFRDIHRMNGLKTILGTLINFIAFLFFAWRGLVIWNLAILMTIGAIVGGYFGARFAKRIDQRMLRAFIIIVGVVVSVYLFFKA
jgi:uncharacterized membrane protein YfcA